MKLSNIVVVVEHRRTWKTIFSVREIRMPPKISSERIDVHVLSNWEIVSLEVVSLEVVSFEFVSLEVVALVPPLTSLKSSE